MTFVGKVLVIVQVVLSLCFMAFAGAVYTVQQDWKEAYEKKVTDLEQKETELQEKNEQISFLNKDLAASQTIEADVASYVNQLDQDLAQGADDDRYKTQLRMLATRLQRTETELSQTNTELADVKQLRAAADEKYAKLQSESKKAFDEAKERAQEAEIFKEINKDLNGQVASLNAKIFNLEDELFNRETDAKSAAEKQKSLLVRVASLRDVIRREGINEEEALKKDEPPPLVYGKVINTKSADRTGPEFVEINIGSDDGLAEDHRLSVYRMQGQARYMGEIHLVHVVADRAVGKAVLKSKNGIIQRGDNVTTKLD